MEETVDADRVVVMINGRIEDEGTPREIFAKRDLLTRAGLIPPFASDVAYRLKDEGFDTGQALTVDELVEGICRSLQKD